MDAIAKYAADYETRSLFAGEKLAQFEFHGGLYENQP
jgi:hypothetical protein